MEQILALLARQPEYRKLRSAPAGARTVRLAGLTGSSRSLLVAQLQRDLPGMTLYVAEAEAGRQQVYRDLQSLLEPNAILMLLPDAQAQLRLLNRLESGRPQVLVTDRATLNARAIRHAPGTELELTLRSGANAARDAVRSWLASAGYELTDLATEPAISRCAAESLTFSRTARATRCGQEFMGDTIESLREFDPLTQRSVKPVEET